MARSRQTAVHVHALTMVVHPGCTLLTGHCNAERAAASYHLGHPRYAPGMMCAAAVLCGILSVGSVESTVLTKLYLYCCLLCWAGRFNLETVAVAVATAPEDACHLFTGSVRVRKMHCLAY